MQKGIAAIVNRLGCAACCSGFDITLLHERDLVINEKLEISSAERGSFGLSMDRWTLPQDPIPHRVIMPTKVSYNLEQVQEVIAKIAGRLGCEACCSGFDITFMHEREFLVDEALNIRSL